MIDVTLAGFELGVYKRDFIRVWEALWRVFGAHQGVFRALMDAIGLSEIAAGAGPAYRKQKAASLAGRVWLMTCRSCSVSAASSARSRGRRSR
jgi:hypothetical protein